MKYSVHEVEKDGKKGWVVCNWKGEIVNNVRHGEKSMADNHATLLNLFFTKRCIEDSMGGTGNERIQRSDGRTGNPE